MGTERNKKLSVSDARLLIEMKRHFEDTTPSQYNRGHMRELIAFSLTSGARDAEYFNKLGLDNADIGAVMRGKAIEIMDDVVRETIVMESDQPALQVLGWDM